MSKDILKEIKKVTDPTDDVKAFAKAFNQICSDKPLKNDENLWSVFKKRDLDKDKIFLSKKLVSGEKASK